MTDDAEWLRQLDGEFTLATRQRLERIASILDNEATRSDEPIPMLLYCPQCGEQHIDEPDERTPDWTNPPHRESTLPGAAGGCSASRHTRTDRRGRWFIRAR